MPRHHGDRSPRLLRHPSIAQRHEQRCKGGPFQGVKIPPKQENADQNSDESCPQTIDHHPRRIRRGHQRRAHIGCEALWIERRPHHIHPLQHSERHSHPKPDGFGRRFLF
jgi:hypothetical protein